MRKGKGKTFEVAHMKSELTIAFPEHAGAVDIVQPQKWAT